MRKIGIYSGKFDPIHNGDVDFARRAKQQLGLEKVYFLVEANPTQTDISQDRRHRLNMAWLATWDDPALELLPSQYNHFSVRETLPELKQQFPDSRFYFLLDQTSLQQLHRRPDFDSLQHQVVFVINQPKGAPVDDLPLAHHQITTELANLTASAVQSLEQTARRALLPKSVSQYIEAQQIYQPASL